ncbi:MAG: methyltransferase domain-containing protein [Planctomycetes bacterium]|nr:methyltransferase domain-containing protein [Planctomycetota bacterium]
MVRHVCPWWGGYFIDNRVRRWLHDPARILGPYVRPGMRVLDFGCGMGCFSIPMADMVGPDGLVIAADLQPRMLRAVRKRADRAGIGGRIRTHECGRDTVGLAEPVDFALAFWSAHEVPDVRRLLKEIEALLVVGGALLVAEPRVHVSRGKFRQMMDAAREIGLLPDEPRCRIRWSWSAALVKDGPGRGEEPRSSM